MKIEIEELQHRKQEVENIKDPMKFHLRKTTHSHIGPDRKMRGEIK